MSSLVAIVQHLPDHLHSWALAYGLGFYLIIGLIIFAETGLVVTPLLPGDSLLFAIGAVLSLHLPNLDLSTTLIILISAALCGDSVNFHVGRWMAPRLFRHEQSRWLNPKYLQKTRAFYARHGGKTVILARFFPIIRTYAPFVTGMSGMKYPRFMAFSFAGAVLWVGTFVFAGYFFGNIPSVKTNFHYAVMAIVVLSLAPLIYEVARTRLIARRARTPFHDT